MLLLLESEGHEGQPPGSDGQGGGGDGPAEGGEAEEPGTGEPAAQHELLSDQNRGGDFYTHGMCHHRAVQIRSTNYTNT